MRRRSMLGAASYAKEAIGQDLAQLRKEAGLSQVAVARKAKIRPEALCRIEKGLGNPTVVTVSRIVKAIEALS